MSWNPVLNKVIEVKREYEKHFIDSKATFVEMLKCLNREEYNDIFDCLQINQDGDFILIRYGLAEMQSGLWSDPNSIYRECRSVVIDLNNECLVLTPFRKFFNLDEVEENKLEVVRKEIESVTRVEIVDKLDGSMQSARWYNGRVFMAGSMALNPKDSWRLEDGYSKLTSGHIEMIDFPNATFIFEYISLKDSHVVKYKKEDEGLYLIGIRNVLTGGENSYEIIKDLGEAYGIPIAKIESLTLDEVLEKMKTLPANEKEGWILNIDGHKIKIKCDDYVNLHRLLDKISSINVVIKNVAEDRVDDMLSKIPDLYRARTEKLAKLVIDWKVDTELVIKNWYWEAPREDRKEFMIWVDNNVPRELRGYVKQKYLKKPYNVLKKHGGGYKKVADMGIEDRVMEVLGCE